MNEQMKEGTEVWGLINLLLNFLGVGVIKLIHEFGQFYSFLDFLQTVALQTFLFAVIYFISYALTRRKNLSLYMFVIVQTILFHSILFYNLTEEGQTFKVITDFNEGILYLIYHSQGLIEMVSIYYPLEGHFGEDSVFMPESTVHFYLLWIILPLVYYFVITFLTHQLLKRQQILKLLS